MKRIHIVSNRLPYGFEKVDGKVSLSQSVGGLATGLKSVYTKYNGTWTGWTGVVDGALSSDDDKEFKNLLKEKRCNPVNLTEKEVKRFYEGFSNKALWPLFHYFLQLATFNNSEWKMYCAVNQKIADAVIAQIKDDDDAVWVHDYQLLLVPEMIKKAKPNVTIGFFLHIPFPSYEVFRVMPWRKEIIKGMLGADLIGFHIYDYERHFFSSVRRLFGYEISFNKIYLEKRIVVADSFPMGIDYDKFANEALTLKDKTQTEMTKSNLELEEFFSHTLRHKLILSIDRLDYSKGIPKRLLAFEYYLKKHPENRKKVSLLMLVVPSRGNVESYKNLKKQVDELVGRINGKYGELNYVPIWYYYRSMPFETLVELYSLCDIALITPLRDGMNLVAKEYVASRTNNDGILILSEMAGVSKEMGEAIIINPNDKKELTNAIDKAVNMPLDEQVRRMTIIKERIKNYDVFRWAGDFVNSLKKVESKQCEYYAKLINEDIGNNILQRYKKAKKRVLFLDYDGTLVGFKKRPEDARPTPEVYSLIRKLISDEKNIVCIISGRDKETLGEWFSGLQINLVSEHGIWYKKNDLPWEKMFNVSNEWMSQVRPLLEKYVVRTPGSFIETKNYSLVWHYRKAELEFADQRAYSLKAELSAFTLNHNLEIMDGSKVIEVKVGGFNKGIAMNKILNNYDADFIMAVGDDWTDEYMFKSAPKQAITIKVGLNNTQANYKVNTSDCLLDLLEKMTEL